MGVTGEKARLPELVGDTEGAKAQNSFRQQDKGRAIRGARE